MPLPSSVSKKLSLYKTNLQLLMHFEGNIMPTELCLLLTEQGNVDTTPLSKMFNINIFQLFYTKMDNLAILYSLLVTTSLFTLLW